jgi:phosphonate transport system substrate-binding protein
MQEHGLSLDDFSAYAYTGSHQNCVNAVVAGKYDACGMQDTMAEDMARQGLVRILYSSSYYPSSGIAAHQDVSMDVVKRVRQALLEFDPQGRHKEGLYHWDKTEMPQGFIEAMDADYKNLREWMLHFDLLEPAKG